jgi:uncharacterized membrane protein
MSTPLPPEIRAEPTRHGTRYILPRRQTGALKAFGCATIAFGSAFAGFAVFWICAAAFATQRGGFSLGGVLFAMFGIPFVLAGLAIIGFGVIAIHGHCEIEFEGGELRARERGGPFRWTRRFQLASIRRFMVSSGAATINDQPVTTGPLSDVGALMAETDAASPRLVVMGYPRAWMDALAARLSADAAALRGKPLGETLSIAPGSTMEESLVKEDRLEPPHGTNIRVTQQGDAVLAILPSTGFKGQARSLLVFAIVWLLISTVVLAAFVAASVSDNVKGDKPPWFIFVFIGLFEAIGIAMLTGAINYARRKASLRASRTDLMIVRQSPFGSKTFKAGRSDINFIRVGPSGTTINDVPVMELQVHSADGKKHGFFAGHSNEELAWLATHLRRTLNVTADEGESLEPPRQDAQS